MAPGTVEGIGRPDVTLYRVSISAVHGLGP